MEEQPVNLQALQQFFLLFKPAVAIAEALVQTWLRSDFLAATFKLLKRHNYTFAAMEWKSRVMSSEWIRLKVFELTGKYQIVLASSKREEYFNKPLYRTFQSQGSPQPTVFVISQSYGHCSLLGMPEYLSELETFAKYNKI